MNGSPGSNQICLKFVELCRWLEIAISASTNRQHVRRESTLRSHIPRTSCDGCGSFVSQPYEPPNTPRRRWACSANRASDTCARTGQCAHICGFRSHNAKAPLSVPGGMRGKREMGFSFRWNDEPGMTGNRNDGGTPTTPRPGWRCTGWRRIGFAGMGGSNVRHDGVSLCEPRPTRARVPKARRAGRIAPRPV